MEYDKKTKGDYIVKSLKWNPTNKDENLIDELKAHHMDTTNVSSEATGVGHSKGKIIQVTTMNKPIMVLIGIVIFAIAIAFFVFIN